jgi:hypothetical protein
LARGGEEYEIEGYMREKTMGEVNGIMGDKEQFRICSF